MPVEAPVHQTHDQTKNQEGKHGQPIRTRGSLANGRTVGSAGGCLLLEWRGQVCLYFTIILSGNSGVLCLSALSQENDLIFARKRGFLGGHFQRKNRGFAQRGD